MRGGLADRLFSIVYGSKAQGKNSEKIKCEQK